MIDCLKTRTWNLDIRTANMSLDHRPSNLEARTTTSKLESASHISRPWSQAGCHRYKIDLEAILFSAPAVASAGSRGRIFVHHIHRKIDFLKIFHYMSRIVQNRFQNRIQRGKLTQKHILKV